MVKERKNKYGFGPFVKYIIGFDILTLIFGGYPVYTSFGRGGIFSVFMGLLITTLNFILGYYFISKFFDRDPDTFLKVVFGSMGIRLILLMLIIIGVILYIKIDQNIFIISLFISYICKSVIEIYFINKKSQIKQVARNTE